MDIFFHLCEALKYVLLGEFRAWAKILHGFTELLQSLSLLLVWAIWTLATTTLPTLVAFSSALAPALGFFSRTLPWFVFLIRRGLRRLLLGILFFAVLFIKPH